MRSIWAHTPAFADEDEKPKIAGHKPFKCVALRCEKDGPRNFRSIVAFAAAQCLIKFVRTA
jgi:hypothetical protein